MKKAEGKTGGKKMGNIVGKKKKKWKKAVGKIGKKKKLEKEGKLGERKEKTKQGR